MKREKFVKKELDEQDDSYVEATPAERLAMLWEMTVDLYSFIGAFDAKQRLQRNVGNLIKKER